ncbi:ATP synthase subunit epsilon, mitochondrial [Monosporozyma unispora]|nr:hypothetical protein C6P44_001023 [Kazachstania unispora]
MTAAWQTAGLTYSTYLALCSRLLRRSLKPELQTAAVKARSSTEAMFTEYKAGGAPKADPAPLQSQHS